MPRGVYRRPPIKERLMNKVHKTKTCWLWQGATSNGGYGTIRYKGKDRGSHRVSYLLFVGPIPKNLEIDHKCRKPGCIRPDHLEAVTHRENVLRGISPAAKCAKKTRCIRGHKYINSNTYFRKDGSRCCRKCQLLSVKKYSIKKQIFEGA